MLIYDFIVLSNPLSARLLFRERREFYVWISARMWARERETLGQRHDGKRRRPNDVGLEIGSDRKKDPLEWITKWKLLDIRHLEENLYSARPSPDHPSVTLSSLGPSTWLSVRQREDRPSIPEANPFRSLALGFFRRLLVQITYC